MNDLAGQEYATIRELRHRFICIFNGAFHSIAKAEFHRKQEREAPHFETKAVGAHQIHDLTAIIFVKLRTNLSPKAESLLEVRLVHAVLSLVTQSSLVLCAFVMCKVIDHEGTKT